MKALGERPGDFEQMREALAAAMEPRDAWETAWVQDLAILRCLTFFTERNPGRWALRSAAGSRHYANATRRKKYRRVTMSREPLSQT
jgi:hypothetical protein